MSDNNTVKPKHNMNNTIQKKGYKETKLGWIPVEWEVVKLGELGKLMSGTTPHRAKHDKYFKNGTIHWIKTTDLNNGVICKTEEKVTETALNETSLKVLPKNTLLIAMYGGFNQIGRTGLLGISAGINQALSALLIEDEKVNPIYLLNWLNFRVNFWKKFAASSRKDPNITKSDVSHFPFFKPPLPEQQKIADILTTWDTAIESTQALIEQLQIRKKGLMQQLLTGKMRLAGFEGEWEFCSLGSLLDYEQPTRYIVKSTNYSNEYTTPVLTAGKTFLLGFTDEKEGIFTNFPVIIFDDFTTASKFVDFEFKVKSSAMKILKLKSNENNLKFIFEKIQLINFSPENHKRYWISEFSNFDIKMPSPEEQAAIAKVIETADLEITHYQTYLAHLQAQKRGLMQQLLTGQKRVKV